MSFTDLAEKQNELWRKADNARKEYNNFLSNHSYFDDDDRLGFSTYKVDYRGMKIKDES